MFDGHDTGFLTVLFSRDVPRDKQRPLLESVLGKVTAVTAEPLITSVSPERLLALEKKARALGSAAKNSLTSYWRIDARALIQQPAQMESLIASLQQLKGVISVTRDPKLVLAVDPTDDPFSAAQRHLYPSPDGVNAQWAWTQPGGDGPS